MERKLEALEEKRGKFPTSKRDVKIRVTSDKRENVVVIFT